MSYVLALAAFVFVLVVGVAIRQRRAVHVPGMPERPATSTATTARPKPPDAFEESAEVVPAELPDRRDPILGAIAWNGDWGWSNREPFRFGGHQCNFLYLAGPAGPGAEHRAWLDAALSRGDALALEARTLAASSRGGDVTADDLLITFLTIGGDEHERFLGGLTCAMPGEPSICYVWSRDRWATLSLERG